MTADSQSSRILTSFFAVAIVVALLCLASDFCLQLSAPTEEILIVVIVPFVLSLVLRRPKSPNSPSLCFPRWRPLKDEAKCGVSPEVPLRNVDIANKVHYFARQGDVRAIENVLLEISQTGQRPSPSLYVGLLGACARAADADRAEYWVQHMLEQEDQVDAVSFSLLIQAFAKLPSELPRAEHWFRRMESMGVQANTLTYNFMIRLCASAGEPARAQVFLEQMEAAGFEASQPTMSRVVEAWAEVGDAAMAENCLEDLLLKGFEPEEATFQAVISACSAAHMEERAANWQSRMAAMAAS